MIINLDPDLAEYKVQCKAKIDAEAEAVRHQFITPGSGQAMVYMEKEREAIAYMETGTIGGHLQSDMDRQEITAYEAATIILFMADAWRDASKTIEELRLTAKDAVDAATTVAEARAATEIDWDGSL